MSFKCSFRIGGRAGQKLFDICDVQVGVVGPADVELFGPGLHVNNSKLVAGSVIGGEVL